MGDGSGFCPEWEVSKHSHTSHQKPTNAKPSDKASLSKEWCYLQMKGVIMVAYFCHYLSDNYVDLSDNYVDLSDFYVDLSDHYVDLSENYYHN